MQFKLAQKTINDLKRLKAKGQPFFLACGFWKEGDNLFKKSAFSLDQALAFAQWKRGQSVISRNYIYTEWKKNGEVIDSMLFDHLKDPQENKNVVNDVECSTVVKEHKHYLSR